MTAEAQEWIMPEVERLPQTNNDETLSKRWLRETIDR
jgi:hypothetical protein